MHFRVTSPSLNMWSPRSKIWNQDLPASGGRSRVVVAMVMARFAQFLHCCLGCREGSGPAGGLRGKRYNGKRKRAGAAGRWGRRTSRGIGPTAGVKELNRQNKLRHESGEKEIKHFSFPPFIYLSLRLHFICDSTQLCSERAAPRSLRHHRNQKIWVMNEND